MHNDIAPSAGSIVVDERDAGGDRITPPHHHLAIGFTAGYMPSCTPVANISWQEGASCEQFRGLAWPRGTTRKRLSNSRRRDMFGAFQHRERSPCFFPKPSEGCDSRSLYYFERYYADLWRSCTKRHRPGNPGADPGDHSPLGSSDACRLGAFSRLRLP
jgi:hypothetical protein